MKKILIYLSLTLSLVAGLLVGLSPSASASFHLIKIREVYAGSATNPMSQFVELQMYSANQVFLAGHSLTVYDAKNAQVGKFTFSSVVTNGANQAYVLLATTQAAAEFGVTADLSMTPVIPPAGGKVCWADDPPSAPVDCASWGNYTGPSDMTGSPFSPTAGIPPGQAMKRDISKGDPSMLEATDDTDDSATDFKLAAPDPHSNGDTGSSPSSSASPSPTPTANPPHIVEHQRSISFDLSGSLTATGKVKASDGYAKCVAGVAVKIQSRAMNGWKTVASTHTKSSGAYRTHIADSPGTYRAKAPSFRADENNQCGAATSKARHHS